MRTWAPSREAAQSDSVMLAEKTRSSLLEVIEQAVPDRQDVVEALRQASNEQLLHPDFFEWYFLIRDKIQEEDDEGFLAALDQLKDVFVLVQRSHERALGYEQALSMKLDLGGVTDSETVHRAADSARDMGASGTPIRVVQEYPPETVADLSAGLRLLQELWPEAHAEVAQAVQQLTLYDDETLKSFADFRRHGSIFICTTYVKDTVILADYILHEASHVRLNTVLSVSPMFLNPTDARFRTPLRKDPRPLFGAFHQMFVLARIFAFYQRATRQRSGLEERREEIRRQLHEGFEVVRENANLTETGEAMLSSIEQMMRE
jgi:hypothetical protein